MELRNKVLGYWLRILFVIGGFVIGAISLFMFLFSEGLWLPNQPNSTEFPVRGVDVSDYQGEIDWPVLASQNIQFAFIKATEGSGFVDTKFKQNWEAAHQTELKVGAYHFLSFDSSGKTQAENFIRTVPLVSNALPPAVDVEFYDARYLNPPSKVVIDEILTDFILAVEAHYGKKPIIYTTYDVYRLYIQGDYVQNPIWFRDILVRPILPDGRQWLFWQYSAKGRLAGFKGEERFIDLNVFKGTLAELREL